VKDGEDPQKVAADQLGLSFFFFLKRFFSFLNFLKSCC